MTKKKLNRKEANAWLRAIVCPVDFVRSELNYHANSPNPSYSYMRYKAILDNVRGRILDIGCNAGGLTYHMRGQDIIGLDYIPWHLRKAQVDCESRKNDIQWVAGSGLCIPFRDEVFDTVVLSEILEHIPDPIDLAVDSWRVVKKGGQMLAVNQNKPDRKFRPTWCRDELNPCNIEEMKEFLSGFKDMEVHITYLDSSKGDIHTGWFIKMVKKNA